MNFKDVLKQVKKNELILGYNESNTLNVNIEDTNSIIITGSTGTGKSVLLDQIILELINTHTSLEMGIMAVDTSGVELSYYTETDYTLFSAINDEKKTEEVLFKVLREIERRQKLLKSMQVLNVDDFNKYSGLKLPLIVLAIDDDKSLLDNTDECDDKKYCSLLDYEVFGIDYKNRKNINKLCKYPDIIWEYIETEDISEESLKLVDNVSDLRKDLDTIHCEDSNIRVNISYYCLKTPSEFLSGTHIVSQQYDGKLKEWVGNYNWKLLYRSSEHDYTAESFHECCDNKGPTLIVIKSSGGWIFGGYTTQSWSGRCIYDMMYLILNR